MIEDAVLEFLDSRLNVATAMEVPSKPPGTFLVVEKQAPAAATISEKPTLPCRATVAACCRLPN